MARTDIHAPASSDFDPEAYVCVGVFDTEAASGDGMRLARSIQHQRDQGRDFAAHVGHRRVCGHCGHALRYVALMVHQYANEMIYVGEDCLANRFEELTKGEFQRLRTEAKLNRERVALVDKRAAFIKANPSVADLLAADAAGETFGFLVDIAAKFRAYGELSNRQVEVAGRVLAEQQAKVKARAEREAAQAAAKASGAIKPAPSGKVAVTGTVCSFQTYDGIHGVTVKMVVEAQDGFRFQVTVPRSIDADVEKGSTVSMNVTLTPREDDPFFAKGLRPSQAKLV